MMRIATFWGIRRPRAGGGFTLVELIAVLVIVAVLAAVSVPALNNATDTRATMAARVLLRDLTFARQRAMVTGTNTWVAFDTNVHTWSVLAEDPEDPGRAGASVIPDPATGRTFTQTLNAGPFAGVLLLGADFDGQPEIGFDWLGQPRNSTESDLDDEGSVTLTGGQRLTVAVGTGKVAYVEP